MMRRHRPIKYEWQRMIREEFKEERKKVNDNENGNYKKDKRFARKKVYKYEPNKAF